MQRVIQAGHRDDLLVGEDGRAVRPPRDRLEVRLGNVVDVELQYFGGEGSVAVVKQKFAPLIQELIAYGRVHRRHEEAAVGA